MRFIFRKYSLEELGKYSWGRLFLQKITKVQKTEFSSKT